VNGKDRRTSRKRKGKESKTGSDGRAAAAKSRKRYRGRTWYVYKYKGIDSPLDSSIDFFCFTLATLARLEAKLEEHYSIMILKTKILYNIITELTPYHLLSSCSASSSSNCW